MIRSLFWVVGTNTDGEAFESQVHFRMWLTRKADGFAITKQKLLHGKTVIGTRQGFVDITREAGIDFVAQHNPLWSTPEWYPKKYGILKYGTGGVAVTDYDNDGWYDIFFADGRHSRLYRNQGNGTFRTVTQAVGLPTEIIGATAALFADFDNDGDKDLFLGRATATSLLYRNDGGTFTDVSHQADMGLHFVATAAAGDYDNDGKPLTCTPGNAGTVRPPPFISTC